MMSLGEALTCARDTRSERFGIYLKLVDTLPSVCRKVPQNKKREMWIITDPERMAAAEERDMASYAKAGRDPLDALIGVRSFSPVAYILNDVIYVPGRKPSEPGVERGWTRVLWKNGIAGKSVILVPYTDSGNLVLVPADRHCSQRFELEFPGGGLVGAKTWPEVVSLQLLEEAGYSVKRIISLERDFDDHDTATNGSFFQVDPSVQGTPIRTFAVRIGLRGEPKPQFGEVIDKPFELTFENFEEIYLHRGSIPHPERPGVRMHLRTGRNAHAYLSILLARKAGILS